MESRVTNTTYVIPNQVGLSLKVENEMEKYRGEERVESWICYIITFYRLSRLAGAGEVPQESVVGFALSSRHTMS